MEQDALMGGNSVKTLYFVHFLSTWNARAFEFAVILFTVAVYPSTLLPVSIRGIAQTIALLLLSAPLGRYIGRQKSRFRSLRKTILLQRACVALACIGYLLLLIVSKDCHPRVRMALFAVIIVPSAIGERLASQGNSIVMERIWVPALSASNAHLDLATLNGQIRRIDLFCKLIAPIVVTVFQTITDRWYSTTPTVCMILVTNLLSPILEIICAREVYLQHPSLQASNDAAGQDENPEAPTSSTEESSFKLFITSEICLPTIALALLYVSTLSLAGPMLTYLLAVGYTPVFLATVRALTALVELSATAIAPAIIRRVGLERGGLWGIWLEGCCLVPVTYMLTHCMEKLTPGNTVVFFSLLALSRLGLWTFDLVFSQIAQTHVPAMRLARFTGVEMTLISMADLFLYVMVGIWSEVEDFKKTAAVSAAYVLGAACLMSEWSRSRRGHLLHWEKLSACGCGDKTIPVEDRVV